MIVYKRFYICDSYYSSYYYEGEGNEESGEEEPCEADEDASGLDVINSVITFPLILSL